MERQTAKRAIAAPAPQVRKSRHAADAAKRPRRPHAERSAETQAKLIKAAISCLHRLGYSATSTTLVADEAAVSRGAMTHQFPSKVDLMLAVVRHVYDNEVREYERLLGKKPAAEAFFGFPSITWKILSRPSGIAVTEIMLASRSDAALAAGLAPVQAAIERDAGRNVLQRLREAGLADRADGKAIHRLFVAAARGLAIESLFTKDTSEIEDAVVLLEKVLHLLFPAKSASPTKRGK